MEYSIDDILEGFRVQDRHIADVLERDREKYEREVERLRLAAAAEEQRPHKVLRREVEAAVAKERTFGRARRLEPACRQLAGRVRGYRPALLSERRQYNFRLSQ